jgi:GNAT superfamily N-acetyltransferase
LTAYVHEVRDAAGLDALDVDTALADVEGFFAERGLFLLATAGDQVVGCVGLRAWTAEQAEIKRMWVSPGRRGTGVAVDLLAAVEERAVSLGYTRVLLDTNGALTAALRFYSAHGYLPVDRYNDNPDATHFFAKDLRLAQGRGQDHTDERPGESL